MHPVQDNESLFIRAGIDIDQTREDQLSSTTSTIFLTVDMILLALNLYFHYLIRRMVSRKDKKKAHVIIQALLKCYSVITPFTFFVLFSYLNILLRYTFPPAEVIGEGFCFVYEFFAHASGLYLGSFTFFTAGMKYWFIVDHAKAKSYGEEKAKNVFLVWHLTLPITMSAFNSLSNGNKDLIYVVNICWGHVETDIPNHAGDVLCFNRHYEIDNYLGENARFYTEPILRVICGSFPVLYIMFCSNVGEFILYALIFRYLNR